MTFFYVQSDIIIGGQAKSLYFPNVTKLYLAHFERPSLGIHRRQCSDDGDPLQCSVQVLQFFVHVKSLGQCDKWLSWYVVW